MSKIEKLHIGGLPAGSYDVFSYSIRGDGTISRDSDMDSNVSAAYVSRLTPRKNEVIEVVCRSQPGGVTLYGSEAARRAYDAEYAD